MKKKNLDTVSLVIPVYNEERYIENFINSILVQDYNFKKIEVIFIDGNSTDKTKSLIKKILSKENVNYKILVGGNLWKRTALIKE